VSVSRWIYRFRGYLISPPLIFAFFCSHFETEAEFIWPLGICLFVSGIVLRIWAQQHLHYRLKVHKNLTTIGPYSFVRNPVYIGNIFICLGATVISELLWLVPITFFYCLAIYLLVVRYEEAHLLDKYGEPYCKYMEKVPRWIPKVFHFEGLGIVNQYLRQSIVIEIHCLLLVLPFSLKEIGVNL
jgi:protein-S-isoprenylcysteine O-methyltransferase Ste14